MSGQYTNASRVSGILKKLLKNRSLPVLHVKLGKEVVRWPEPSIEVLRKQGWNIDTWRNPEGTGSTYFLNTDPRELLDMGYSPLFMSLGKIALDVRQASRRKVVSIYKKRTGDQEQKGAKE